MSLGHLIPVETIKITQLLVLGVIGGYFVFRGLRSNKQNSGQGSDHEKKHKGPRAILPGADPNLVLQNTVLPQDDTLNRDIKIEPTLQELEDKYGSSPEIFYDEVEKHYVVVDPKNADNLLPISIKQIKVLNGGVLPEGVEEEPLLEQAAGDDITTEPEQELIEPQENREAAVLPQNGVIGIEDFEDFQEDAVDFELEQRNAQLEDQQAMEFQQQEMAANATGFDPAARQNRTIGAKKAKSLQRKDQRRAYHEYMRDISAARRAEEEEYEQQHGELIALEREERLKRNEEAEREQKARIQKQKDEEELLKQAKEEMRERLHGLKPGEYLPISDPEEIKIAHGLPDAFVVNNESFVVRLSKDDIQNLAESIAEHGSMSFEEMAKVLTEIKA